jgi:hypothetical protein
MFYYDPVTIQEADKAYMKLQFEQLGWNTTQAIGIKLKWIEDRLIEQQDSKWIFVIGNYYRFSQICIYSQLSINAPRNHKKSCI